MSHRACGGGTTSRWWTCSSYVASRRRRAPRVGETRRRARRARDDRGERERAHDEVCVRDRQLHLARHARRARVRRLFLLRRSRSRRRLSPSSSPRTVPNRRTFVRPRASIVLPATTVTSTGIAYFASIASLSPFATSSIASARGARSRSRVPGAPAVHSRGAVSVICVI